MPAFDLLTMAVFGCAMVAAAAIAVLHTNLTRAVMAYAVSSICLAGFFFLLASPYAASLELTVGAGLVAVLFLAALILAGGEECEAPS